MSTNTKRLSKEQLLDIISAFATPPTINQLVLFYENNVKPFNNLSISQQLLRYYIRQYKLEDYISKRRYTYLDKLK